MENLSFSVDDLFKEVVEIARAQGAFSKEMWDDVVETLLEDKRERQEIDDDADMMQLTEALKSRFDVFRDSVESL